jgi:ABC-type lipoprotein export system ATPase subunit/GNAT superfamily N-acetyltransferase
VRAGDKLEIESAGEQLISVYKQVHFSANDNPALVQLFPPYDVSEIVELAPHSLRTRFRERKNNDDLRSIKLLEKFHYRGHGLNKIVGRRTVLLAEAEGVGIVAYGILSATVCAAKPRFEIFKTNIGEQMRTKLINKIVRIPRIVVHPEYRGLGIGSRMAKHLVQYAASHWDINGYKPILVEVIASMTQYHKFFQLAGFIEAGATGGDWKEGLKPLYGKGNWQERPNSNSYKFFCSLGPKPYLVFPICDETRERISIKYKSNGNQPEPLSVSPSLKRPIVFKKVSASYLAHNRLTKRASEVKAVFGVDSSQMCSPVLENFSLTIQPADVVLVTGASGSGKSTLIRLLVDSPNKRSSHIMLTGEIDRPSRKEIEVLSRDWKNSAPLIDQVGQTLEDSIAILNSVGLAEAHLYLKTPNQISEGQRYRFSVAHLCDSHKSIWIADEFASTLDPYTAAVVAKGIRKQAYRRGATLIIAAPHIEHFAESLLPTQLVRLQWGGLANIYGMKILYKLTERGFRFWIENRTSSQLSGVQITIIDSEGKARTIAEKLSIKGKEKGAEVEILFSALSDVSAVRAYSEQGVGDIVLFK